jgi:hypothetical protein
MACRTRKIVACCDGHLPAPVTSGGEGSRQHFEQLGNHPDFAVTPVHADRSIRAVVWTELNLRDAIAGFDTRDAPALQCVAPTEVGLGAFPQSLAFVTRTADGSLGGRSSCPSA